MKFEKRASGLIVPKRAAGLTRRGLMSGLAAAIIVPRAADAMLTVNELNGLNVGGEGDGSLAPPLDGVSGLTGGWSMGRPLLTSYVGLFYIDSSGAVSSLQDQSTAGGGPSRDFVQGTAANRPTIATAGPQSRACATFDGTNDGLATAFDLSNFIAAGAGYVIASFIAVSVGTNAANVWENDPVFGDTTAFMGAFLKSGTPNINSYNWDGSSDTAAITIATGTLYVVEWRHTGGNLSMRINGGSYSTVASGNTSGLAGFLSVGHRGHSGVYANMNLFEMAVFSTVPSQGNQDAIAANFLAWAA